MRKQTPPEPDMLHRTMTYCAHLVLYDQRRVAEEAETREGLSRRLARFVGDGSIRHGTIFLDGMAVARWAPHESRFVPLPDAVGWD